MTVHHEDSPLAAPAHGEPGTDVDDAVAIVDRARALWTMVSEQNVLVRIPATDDGLAAMAAVIGDGISVEVTPIFSLDRYRDVIDAYLTGLEYADLVGHDLSKIHSVASLFVSRLDTIGTPRAFAANGEAAIARQAHQIHEDILAGERWRRLAAAGARPQRPLWAPTLSRAR